MEELFKRIDVEFNGCLIATFKVDSKVDIDRFAEKLDYHDQNARISLISIRKPSMANGTEDVTIAVIDGNHHWQKIHA
jgi:hypothetical protein